MSHNESKPESCLNCGYQFKDENNYCPSCGQENHSLQVPLKHLILEFLEGTLHLDTKIVKTFSALLFKPGFLSREFNTGKRAKYVPPVRIYVFVSFIFFLLANLLTGPKPDEKNQEKVKMAAKDDGTVLIHVGADDPKNLSSRQIDSILAANKVKQDGFGKVMMEKSKKLNNEEGKKEFSHNLLKYISYLMFFLMPLFAWFVMLFNIKKDHYYFEYLIYSIHFHSFAFLLMSLFLIVNKFYDPAAIYVLLAVLLISAYYFMVSMKRTFPQKRFSAVWKSLSIIVIYGIAFGLSLLGAVVLSVWLL